MCYLKKAFFLVQDIMEDTLRFKDSTPNAKAIQELQELSLRLKSCYTQDYEENNKVGWAWVLNGTQITGQRVTMLTVISHTPPP